jgi:hypothetical protein
LCGDAAGGVECRNRLRRVGAGDNATFNLRRATAAQRHKRTDGGDGERGNNPPFLAAPLFAGERFLIARDGEFGKIRGGWL